jgi:thiosulfate/3-mercaptopyruvate sulfurtransferase
MKKRSIIAVLFMVLFALSLTPALYARDVEPIISTDWLEKNLSNPKVVVVDVRKVEDYKAGHIPGAVNAFYGSWAVGKGGLRNEVPPADDLFDTIASAGIGMDSVIVLVGKADGIPERTEPTRVAWTLKYAGLENIAILDGGYNKWVADKKAVSTDAVKPKAAKEFKGKTRNELFAGKDYVMSHLGKTLIIDVREVPFYKGEKKLEFVPKTGRIKGAVNLPTSAAYTKDGTFKTKADLEAAAVTVVGNDKSKEIILYCDTGKVCTAWAYILTELFGYKDVKDYDGSTEEWMKDPEAPVEP